MINFLEINTSMILLDTILLLALVSWSYWVFEKARRISKLELNISNTIKSEAEEIINQTKEKSKLYLDSLNKSLDEIAKNQLLELQKIVKEASNTVMDSISKGLEKEFEQVIANTKVEFEQDYKKTVQEIEQYKTLKIQTIDEQAKEFLTKIAKDVLPKGISLEDHYQILEEALEKARKTGFSI